MAFVNNDRDPLKGCNSEVNTNMVFTNNGRDNLRTDEIEINMEMGSDSNNIDQYMDFFKNNEEYLRKLACHVFLPIFGILWFDPFECLKKNCSVTPIFLFVNLLHV